MVLLEIILYMLGILGAAWIMFMIFCMVVVVIDENRTGRKR